MANKQNKIAKFSLCAFFITAQLHFGVRPAFAADDFAKGCQLYTAKNYAQAEPILADTVKKYPKYWPGHYYLGHTLLAEGKSLEARKEYEACLTCLPAPGPDVISACQKVISSLGGTVSDPLAAAAGADPAAASAAKGAVAEAAAGEKKEEPESYRDKEKRWHIERLKKMCAEKIAALRQECKDAIAYATSQASTYFKITPDSFGRSIQLSEEEQARIEKEYQDKITKVQEECDREIAGLN